MFGLPAAVVCRFLDYNPLFAVEIRRQRRTLPLLQFQTSPPSLFPFLLFQVRFIYPHFFALYNFLYSNKEDPPPLMAAGPLWLNFLYFFEL
ncbi:hypothetical protein PRIO_5216 [Paenibacillus riograndensis SBR5]|uniref:Uncharacterized protein n=1 Tax=Paenibacillus riograndensis SBR5 TaxID=1073571 RepID=A0A0E4HCY2_9BACL|nr:hypothetical protein PRIO_5216 [Paenibacillus riograndensis SBR5]